MLRLIVVSVFIALASGRVPIPQRLSLKSSERQAEAAIELFPFQVSLQYFGVHFCGGSIYRSNVIVTAARCVLKLSASQLVVIAGTTNYHYDRIQRKVQKIVYNNGYSPLTSDFDIAILILADPFEITESVQTIELANTGDAIPDGSLVRVSGWGTAGETEQLSENLQYADAFIYSQASCNVVYDGRITENMICGTSYFKWNAICSGDFGGPLTFGGKLFGIVSWTRSCTDPDYPGVYTRISSLRSWIDAQIIIHTAFR